ncbi:MAG: cupredoxin domain-containing protein [Anaerolineales bacterium]|nr:cupredoxin domain-containing protein [Anaerolineales bacterium]
MGGAARAEARRGETCALGGLLGVVGLAVVFSVALTLADNTSVSAQARAGAITVEMKNYAFTPITLQAQPGVTVRLLLKNDDSTLHSFTLPAAGVDVSVPPGTEKLAEFIAPAGGAVLARLLRYRSHARIFL